MALKRTTARRLSRLKRVLAPMPEIDTSGMTPQEQVMYDMERYGLEAMVLAQPPLETNWRPQSVAVEPPPPSPPATPAPALAPAAPTEPPAPPLWHEEYVRWRPPGEPLPDYFMEDLDDDEEDDEDFLWTE